MKYAGCPIFIGARFFTAKTRINRCLIFLSAIGIRGTTLLFCDGDDFDIGSIESRQ